MTATILWGGVAPFAAAALIALAGYAAGCCRRRNLRDGHRLDCRRRHPSRRRRTPGLPLDGKPLAPDARDAEIALLRAVYGMHPAPEVTYEEMPETEGDWG